MLKAALYVRLSKEDEDKKEPAQKSESIQNQVSLLKEYASKNHMEISGVYVDDDFSGLYDDRPEFTRLLADARERKMNVILCKSQSRFTRNIYHSEKYLEELLPSLDIRFIGILDGADTNMYQNKKSRQINSLINDWYVEDLSNNIRAVFQKKMKDGQNLASFATYGYRKDPNDRHQLIIDENSAKVVRYIYCLYRKGAGVSRIAELLTEEKIPTPYQYKQEKGLKYFNPNKKYTSLGLWSVTTIKRILTNEAYIGNLVQGRERKVSYKSKKVINMPENEWVIVKNHHQAIIEEDEFKDVQNLLRLHRKSSNVTPVRVSHIFSGRIFCHDCKHNMTKTSKSKRSGYEYLCCQLFKKSKGVQCTRHSIRYDVLEKDIRGKLKEILKCCVEDQKSHAFIVQHISRADTWDKKIAEKQEWLDEKERETVMLQTALETLYLDKATALISIEEYKGMREKFITKLEKNKNDIQILENTITKLEEQKLFSYDLNSLVEDYVNCKKLTFEMVNDYISFIEIGEKVCQSQDIIIHWKEDTETKTGRDNMRKIIIKHINENMRCWKDGMER